MKRLFYVVAFLLSAFSCTEQEEVSQKEISQEEVSKKGERIMYEGLPGKSRKGDNALASDPNDPFGYACDPQHPGYNQECCDNRPMSVLLTWESTTHPFTIGAGNKYTYDGPSGRSNYRITATAGQALNYNVRLVNPVGESTRVQYKMYLVPADGQYAQLVTSYGTLTYDPANGGEGAGPIELGWTWSYDPLTSYTIPSNPYPTRLMRVKIVAAYFNWWPEGVLCAYGSFLNDEAGGFGITDFNDRPWLEITLPPSSNITYLGSTSMPGNGGSDGGGITVATPPANMQVGDLVVLYGVARDGGATIAQSQLGGQTWNTLPNMSGAPRNVSSRAFWCRFNGTWTANPSLNITANNGPRSAILHVFRPTNQSKQWAVDVPLTSALHSVLYSPYTATINGVTTVNTSTVTIASWSGEGIRWFSTAPAGWTNLGPTEYKNIGGADTSTAFRYKIKNTPGATGNVSSTLTGPLHTVRSIVSFYEY